jgi:hypothetical protein
MPNTREFDLSDILSVVPGCLVSSRHMDGVYDILNFMTGDNLFTHQLPRAMGEARPVILAQHPWLASIALPVFPDDVTADDVYAWLDAMEAEHGATVDLEPMAPEDHTHIDPISELGLMGVPAVRVVVVETDS